MKEAIDLSQPCDHVTTSTIRAIDKPAVGCEECLKIGSEWVHLRECLTCGHIGCCDNSPRRHATAHNKRTHHPVIGSAEVGETWAYCYPDDAFLSS